MLPSHPPPQQLLLPPPPLLPHRKIKTKGGHDAIHPTPSSATATTTTSLNPATFARRVAATGPKVALSATFPSATAAGKTKISAWRTQPLHLRVDLDRIWSGSGVNLERICSGSGAYLDEAGGEGWTKLAVDLDEANLDEADGEGWTKLAVDLDEADLEQIWTKLAVRVGRSWRWIWTKQIWSRSIHYKKNIYYRRLITEGLLAFASKGGTLKHQPSSSTSSADEAIQRLTQLLDQRDHENRALREEYSDLRDEFSSFKALVMRALPQTSDTPSIVPPTQPRPSPSPAVPHPPTPVQPTPVQPSTDDQEDEHVSEDYVDF
ncbi:hypothetical protein LR48_Vigan11g064800 [Vigna angularis]|uniref:Uncharacterized protein n=1 Tax=Phaseolus angularis TaxID=3914 RepID=A0A0L9VRC0_PHAAN|nr:hypothetical protein LR48_Vigan11g064800 [Vigna angularis]